VQAIVEDFDEWEADDDDDEITRRPWFLLPCGSVGMDLLVTRQTARARSGSSITEPPDLMRLSYSDDNDDFVEWDLASTISDYLSALDSGYSVSTSNGFARGGNGSAPSSPIRKPRNGQCREMAFEKATEAPVNSLNNRIFVFGVEYGSPAYDAMFKDGDEIVEWMGDRITSVRQLYYAVMSCPSIW